MAIAMEFLKHLPIEKQVKIIKEMSEMGKGCVHVEIDGRRYLIPEEVNDLIESLSSELDLLKNGL
jgi:hypothetical protein